MPDRPDPDPQTPDPDEPMSKVQRTTLQNLCSEAGVAFDATLSTAGAARRVTELQQRKDQATEAARAARGVVPEAVQSDAGEEDPGAALDAPGNKQGIGAEAAASKSGSQPS